jgi:membrane protease YdiL (CAAX protease family)
VSNALDQSGRRRVVVGATLLIGAALLGLAFAQPAGSTAFYLLTLALAVVGATGGLLSGPIPLGLTGLRDRRLTGARGLPVDLGAPIALGAIIGGVFIAGGAIVRHIGPLRPLINDVVTHTHGTSFALILVVTIVNAIAEEIFFRGAVYAAFGSWHPAVMTTVVYVAAISVSGDPALIFAAAVLGAVLAIERQRSGGVLAPILTHVTWSIILLTALPPLFPH